MFAEITEEAYEQIKMPLDAAGYTYDIMDVTMPKDSIRHFSLDFGDLAKKDIRIIADMLDEVYRTVAVKSKDKKSEMER